MAIHAGLGGRNARDSGSFDASVTVAAVDAVIAGMMFVTELDGLLANDILPRKIRGMSESEYGSEPQTGHQSDNEQTESSVEIGAAMKNLGHDVVALIAAECSWKAQALFHPPHAGKGAPGS